MSPNSELWLDHENENNDEVVAHPTAIVHPRAELGKRVRIGPYSVIGPKVICDDEVEIGSNVNVSGRTFIGKATKIWHYCSIGTVPQDLKYRGEDTRLIIGVDNSIREYVNISIGTEGGGGVTRIGDRNLFMVNVHLAHDCIVGNNCIFANGVNIAGHVEMDNHVVFGGMSGVHQFCRFGSFSMITGGSYVGRDVPPFCRVHGNRAKILGLNSIGLKRAGMSSSIVADIKKMYNLIYNESQTLADALENVRTQVKDSTEKKMFLDFFSSGERGLCR